VGIYGPCHPISPYSCTRSKPTSSYILYTMLTVELLTHTKFFHGSKIQAGTEDVPPAYGWDNVGLVQNILNAG